MVLEDEYHVIASSIITEITALFGSSLAFFGAHCTVGRVQAPAVYIIFLASRYAFFREWPSIFFRDPIQVGQG